ncbi:hypothetical protein, partial [Streptomyces sp. NRRL F-5122]|uniref:hypothetical protein n=1 Tax=Streptomyces sp. NRRL F-5122 TaxID=1609098 RepID=UPI003B6365E9
MFGLRVTSSAGENDDEKPDGGATLHPVLGEAPAFSPRASANRFLSSPISAGTQVPMPGKLRRISASGC